MEFQWIGNKLAVFFQNVAYYSTNAPALVEQYDSVPFEPVHSGWLQIIPKKGMVFDGGATSDSMD